MVPSPCKAEPRHWPVPCILPRDLIPQLLFQSLISASFIYTLLFQGEALVISGSCTAVGGQHRAQHVGNSGTELTNSACGRHWQGAEGRNTWHCHHLAPPLPCTSLHAEQKLYMKRLQCVKKNVGNKRKLTWQVHPPTPYLDMDASISKHQCQKHQSILTLNRLLLSVL